MRHFSFFLLSSIPLLFIQCSWWDHPYSTVTSVSYEVDRSHAGTSTAVPLSHPLLLKMQSHSHRWQDFDDQYRQQLTEERDSAYWPNLQWLAISHLVQSTYFVINSNVAQRDYYLRQLAERKFIPNPGVVLELLETTSPQDVAAQARYFNLSQAVQNINYTYLGPEKFSTHYQTHEATYTLLDAYADALQ